LLAFSLITGILLSGSAKAQDQARIAYFNAGTTYSVHPEFLQRTKAAGYNYVQVELGLVGSDWDGRGGLSGSSLRTKMRDLFAQADAHGLRVIPEFQLGGQWASHWRVTNANITWNWNTSQSVGTPTFAPDPSGIDASFSSLIRAIKDGFADAVANGLSYKNLDFIHIGHDEPVDIQKDIGLLLIGRCNADTSVINTYRASPNNLTLEQAFQRLYGDEVKRRVDAIASILPTTKALAYADILDPSHNGAIAYATTYGPSVTMANAVLSPGIQAVRNKLVVMPWVYDVIAPTGRDYDTYKTFTHFKNAGLPFIYGMEAFSGNGTSFTQLGEFIGNANLPEFRAYANGFASMHWTPWKPGTAAPACYASLEYVSQWAYHLYASF
jgi:hypothetical protein